MKQLGLFEPPEPEIDSCILALCLAEEKYQRQRQFTPKEHAATRETDCYQATDDDLPAIFWEPPEKEEQP